MNQLPENKDQMDKEKKNGGIWHEDNIRNQPHREDTHSLNPNYSDEKIETLKALVRKGKELEHREDWRKEFQAGIPPRGLHPYDGDFVNGDSKVYEFGHKTLRGDEVFTVVDWANIGKFIERTREAVRAETIGEIYQQIEQFPNVQLRIHGNRLPFVVHGGRADESEKIAIYHQGIRDVLNVVRNLARLKGVFNFNKNI